NASSRTATSAPRARARHTPATRSAAITTGISGFTSRWTSGSSLPYPRITIAGCAPRSTSRAASHAAVGVFPVPPTVRLPTLTLGSASLTCSTSPASKSAPRTATAPAYTAANGHSKARAARARASSLYHMWSVVRGSITRCYRVGLRHERLEARGLAHRLARTPRVGDGWRTVGDGYARKRLGDEKPVPARETPCARRAGAERNDRRPGALGDDEHAGRERMCGSARAIGCERRVPAAVHGAAHA